METSDTEDFTPGGSRVPELWLPATPRTHSPNPAPRSSGGCARAGHRHRDRPVGAAGIQIEPPDLPAQPITPPNGPSNTLTEVVLQWHPIEGAVTYNVQLSTDQNFLDSSVTQLVTGIKSTRYSPPQTVNNDQYYWRVQPVNADAQVVAWDRLPVWQFRRDWTDQPHLEFPRIGPRWGALLLPVVRDTAGEQVPAPGQPELIFHAGKRGDEVHHGAHDLHPERPVRLLATGRR